MNMIIPIMIMILNIIPSITLSTIPKLKTLTVGYRTPIGEKRKRGKDLALSNAQYHRLNLPSSSLRSSHRFIAMVQTCIKNTKE